jgi:polygalacturonase
MSSLPAYPRLPALCALALALSGLGPAQAQPAGPNPTRSYDIRAFGATGDGKTLDTDAINRTIAAAAAAGGGTVEFPPGTYLSFSIRLQSHVWLHLNPGATIVAAAEAPGFGHYDEAEPSRSGSPDIGGSFHNSLIWGDSLEDIAITGSGVIYGKGLPRQNGGSGRDFSGPRISLAPNLPASVGLTLPGRGGNKSIGLVNCRNVLLRDFWVRQGGWSAMDALGIDNFTIENVKVDTNRDGFDVDCCRNVRISDCTINALNDDGICLKSPDSLGVLRACENITITGCLVSGYDTGSVFDGTYRHTQPLAPDRDGPTGRIKFGTGSAGGFKNITIANCVFDRSRGLALEAVDGGTIENVTITNIAMRNVSNAAIFLRIGDRGHGPAGRAVGAIHGVSISHIVASDVDGRFPIILAGLPGHPIEDVRLSDIRIRSRGGFSLDDAAKQPANLVNRFFLRAAADAAPRDPYLPPEQASAYPEPSMFGVLPAWGLYVRHAKDLAFRDVKVTFDQEDTRPVIVLDDVAGAEFKNVKAQHGRGAPTFVLRKVTDFSVGDSSSVPDRQLANAEQESL